jgi:dTMP kinase
MNHGRFITFEGIDGAGKSTQVDLLCAALTAGGIDWYRTREPGGSQEAESLRDCLLRYDWDGLEETFILMAGRANHVRTVIWPELNAGNWVICDRFVDTTVAYQGWGRSVSLDLLERLNLLAVGDCWPDLTVLLDVPASVARARFTERRLDRMEVLGDGFFEQVRQGFRAQTKSREQIFMVDAEASADVVHARVIEEVERKFGVELS